MAAWPPVCTAERVLENVLCGQRGLRQAAHCDAQEALAQKALLHQTYRRLLMCAVFPAVWTTDRARRLVAAQSMPRFRRRF